MVATADIVTEKQRISSIDLARGLVMVIMALDHTRDFFHQASFGVDPTSMQTTTPALFFTRWITHYCAPTFVFLAGTSIFVNLQRKSKQELSTYLLTRGLWLIVLEFVVIRFGILFNFYYDVFIFQVIWVIGASMVCMAALIHLPYTALVTLGFVIVFGHNLFDLIQVPQDSPFLAIWSVFRQSGFVVLNESRSLFVPYPLLPWLGIMLLGFGLGKVYVPTFDPEKRRKLLLLLGGSAILMFIILRGINRYGDPAPWSIQKNAMFTFMSFLNTTKYPVSLLYALMTLGPMLVLLSLFERVNVNALRPLSIFGRVPMFYYILHFYLIHAVSILLFMQKTGHSWSEIDFHFNRSFGGITAEGGYSLFITYIAWISVVVFLYPICKWYYQYKSTHRDWWLSYI